MTINSLIEQTGLSRYYITRAARASGVEIHRGRKPTILTREQVKKIRQILRIVFKVKTLRHA